MPSNNSKINLQDGGSSLFWTVCEGFETSVSLFHSAVHDVLAWKDEILVQALPSSVLLSLTSTLSKLHRSFIDMSFQGNELVRLVRLYSAQWKEKSESLEALHNDHQQKKHMLNIAIQKYEVAKSKNCALEKEKALFNWERMYVILNSALYKRSCWRRAVHQLQRGRIVKLSQVDHASMNSPNLEPSDQVSEIECPSGALLLASSYAGPDKSFDSPVELHMDASDMKNYQPKTAVRVNQHVSLSGKNLDLSTFVDSVTPASTPDHCISSITREELKFQVNDSKLISKPTLLLETKSTWTGDPNIEWYGVICISNINCPYLHNPWFTVALNSLVEKSHPGKVSQNSWTFCIPFICQSSDIHSSLQYSKGCIKIAAHPDVNKSIVAMASVTLPCLSTSVIEDVCEMRDALSTGLRDTKPNLVTLFGSGESNGLKFNQPCGTMMLSLTFVKISAPRHGDKAVSTDTFGAPTLLKATNGDGQKKQLVSRAVGTEDTASSLLGVPCVSTKPIIEFKDMASSPIIMLDNENAADDDVSPKVKTPVSQRKNPKKKYGNNLPENFFERLALFEEASQQHLSNLKSKTQQNVTSSVSKRLEAERKYNLAFISNSAYAKDVSLPALFMPRKQHATHVPKGRSYLNLLQAIDGS